MKNIYIIRGCSGSGKTTVAIQIDCLCRMAGIKSIIATADDFFMSGGEYKFDASKLGIAHERCQEKVKTSMEFGIEFIIVANTSTTEKELKPYIDLAKSYGYKVISLIVENRHGNKDVHDVPWVGLSRQENNLKNSLKLLPNQEVVCQEPLE